MARFLSLVVLALVAVACSAPDARVQLNARTTAGAAPAAPAPDTSAEPTASRRVPDLVGTRTDDLPVRLSGSGVRAQVVTYDDSEQVTAQYPAAGSTVPSGATVTLWVGPPPDPPSPPPAPTATPAVTAAPPPGAPPEPLTAPEPRPGPVTSRPAVEPAATAPPPPRSNIRTLPPAAIGTTLEGPASWYGDEFAGSPTACGGVFDPAQLTMATRELRCGTWVRVTGPAGASVDVVVTDWGPAEWTNHRFDLSEVAFGRIAAHTSGVIPVTVQVLQPPVEQGSAEDSSAVATP